MFLFFCHRDLLKWCDRISVNFNGTSSTTGQHVFQEVNGDYFFLVILIIVVFSVNCDELLLINCTRPANILHGNLKSALESWYLLILLKPFSGTFCMLGFCYYYPAVRK